MRNLLLAVAVTALVLMLPQQGGAAMEGPPEVHVTCVWLNGEVLTTTTFVVHPREMMAKKRLCTNFLRGEVTSVEFIRP